MQVINIHLLAPKPEDLENYFSVVSGDFKDRCDLSHLHQGYYAIRLFLHGRFDVAIILKVTTKNLKGRKPGSARASRKCALQYPH